MLIGGLAGHGSGRGGEGNGYMTVLAVLVGSFDYLLVELP